MIDLFLLVLVIFLFGMVLNEIFDVVDFGLSFLKQKKTLKVAAGINSAVNGCFCMTFLKFKTRRFFFENLFKDDVLNVFKNH